MINRLLRLTLLGLYLAAGVFVFSSQAAAQPAPNEGRPDSVTLRPSADNGGVAVRSAGLAYLSPIQQAPRPFTHLLLRWDATVPVTYGLSLEARVSGDGNSWTDWGAVLQNPDLWQPADGPTIYWSQVLYAGEASFYQVRAIATEAPDGTLPTLRDIQVHTVDSRFAPTADGRRQTADDGQAADAVLASSGLSSIVNSPSAIGKPSVVSRSAWGSPDGQGSRVKPVYYRVNHMVVHHTADSNSLSDREQNWADRVRAEWSFHTYTRGWGDVGYNFLIDPNGVVYEGRSGGDDAVAFHDTANYGSMGVVLIGTYQNVQPTATAQQSLVKLLAWKADHRDIDPLGRSFYYGCSISRYCKPFAQSSLVENIAGHRQVTPGHTTCPGDQLQALLPGIRNRVRDTLQGGSGSGGGNPPPPTDNGDLLIEELEGGFSRSSATWYDASCGYGGHTYYTYATDRAAESTNSANWRPNIPAAGRYRVYAHIPQGCALASPPYASGKAVYRIRHAGGEVQRTVNHNIGEEWLDLGSYQFDAGTNGYVSLNDLTGEPYSQRRVIFFDSIKWVPDTNEAADVQLLRVEYDRTTLPAGDLLRVTFTVRNNGTGTARGQEPRNGGDPANGYVYDENECYEGAADGSYPAFPKEPSAFRVVLGALERSTVCAGDPGGYPWRWGLSADLAPGQEQQIVGYVRFRNPGSATLQAGVVQEYVRYHTQGVALTSITIGNEQVAPMAAAYDELLRPVAHVYQLGTMPANFLARTANILSVPRGEYLGSFVWEGTTLDWGEGGPLGVSDGFLVQQVRMFRIYTAGTYTFRTTSDDGSWLWVNGTSVVVNSGLHAEREVTGEIYLNAGVHSLAFAYFDRTGLALASYAMRAANDSAYSQPIDALGNGAVRIGATFAEPPALTLAADDMGGTGVARISYSWDGQTWIDSPGNTIEVGRLLDGDYTLRYRPIDAAGNNGPNQQLRFSVNSNLPISRMYLPLIGPPLDL